MIAPGWGRAQLDFPLEGTVKIKNGKRQNFKINNQKMQSCEFPHFSIDKVTSLPSVPFGIIKTPLKILKVYFQFIGWTP